MALVDDCFGGHLLTGSLEQADGDEEMKGKVERPA